MINFACAILGSPDYVFKIKITQQQGQTFKTMDLSIQLCPIFSCCNMIVLQQWCLRYLTQIGQQNVNGAALESRQPPFCFENLIQFKKVY